MNAVSTTNQCEIIQDLLPLYTDEVCSPASHALVEQHLKECEHCAAIFNAMQNVNIERCLIEEKENVLEHQAKGFRRRSTLIGSIFAAVFCLPILFCFIVNLAVGHVLSWFFMVLTAMMFCASLIVVPLVVPKNKFITTVCASNLSLLILLLTCCLYTGGSWFFVAATAILFGESLILLPVIVNCEPLKTQLTPYKKWVVIGCDAIMFMVMMFTILT